MNKIIAAACIFWINTCLVAQTNIDIIKINTFGQAIVDEPKTNTSIEIISTNGNTNSSDDKLIFLGNAGIELRGSSSAWFPKQPYSFEIRDIDGIELDTSLFGWPSESDYILFASYTEKSLMHNVLTMQIANQMGIYASRTRYVDLYINNEYLGVYVLMEKVKRAKGRVDIAKLVETDIAGDDLTGGYIIKLDKTTGGANGGWYSKYPFDNFPSNPYYQFEYPKILQPVQQEYIIDYVDDFEKALKSNNYKDPITGYKKYIDIESFVKLLLVNEVSFNVDGYRISTFLYKDKNQKLKAGPPWDYDLSFGNADYCAGWTYNNFSYDFNTVCPQDGYQIPFWWKRMNTDTAFTNTIKRQYTEYRKRGILQDSRLNDVIDSLYTLLKFPQKRNFEKWPILGTYVWPNPEPIPTSWDGEVSELRSWLYNRMKWLDSKWLLKEDTAVEETSKTTAQILFSPNPISGYSTITFPNTIPEENMRVEVLNYTGQVLAEFIAHPQNHTIDFDAQSILNHLQYSGLYLFRFNTKDKTYYAKAVINIK